jgi:predicted AAA+ superfamily ATPase
MVQRSFWQQKIEQAWRQRPIVWLNGVRRVGKTSLCQSLPDVEYFDCELPRVRRLMDDPEDFLAAVNGRRIVLDDVHRLAHPAELLKISADHHPTTRVVATGSSALHASAKFRDMLTGRKVEVWLTPVIECERDAFGHADCKRRLLHGGLPAFLLAEHAPERDMQEWMDSYWSKDVLELFRLERRASFQCFMELLFANSGGIFQATACARPCEVSRQTIMNYLAVLAATRVAHVIRPFSGRRATEIVAAPKVYAFDTGFVCACKAWQTLRPDDCGLLWEHYVLNEMQAHGAAAHVRYWRDKRGHEVDFVLARPGHAPTAIECKWSSAAFNPRNVRAFRHQHPRGINWLVAHDVTRPMRRHIGELEMELLGIENLGAALSQHGV